jgi:hypothetical protein
MPDRTDHNEHQLSPETLIADLDEENLAWVLSERFDSYCEELEESGLNAETVRRVRPALEWTYIYAAQRMAYLADRAASDIHWRDVAEQLEKLLKGEKS